MDNLAEHATTIGLANDSRCWTTDDVSFAMDSAYLLITSKYHPNPFLILRIYCENPDCSCKDVTFRFTEVVDKRKFSKPPITFDLRIDVPEWKVTGEAPVSEKLKPLVERFVTGIDEEAKNTFRDELKAAKEHGSKADRFTISVEDVMNGAMVPYCAIFADGGSILHGGQEASFSFTYEGVSYLIEDTYCIDPACDCAKTMLVFLLKDDASKTLRDAFDVTIKLGGRVEEIIPYNSFTAKKAKRIVNAWKAEERNILAIIEQRYDEIKSIGARILEENQDSVEDNSAEDNILGPGWDIAGKKGGLEYNAVGNELMPINKTTSIKQTAPSHKTGRNDPCPCGSGKKYKKCCGASKDR
jgi:hypothetical protein